MIGTTSIACNTVILLSLSTDNLTKTFGVKTMNNETINNTNNAFRTQSAIGSGIDGLHANNSWLNAGVKAFDDGLTIDIIENGFNYHYDSNIYFVSNELAIQTTMYQPLQALPKNPSAIKEFLTMLSSGYGSPAQAQFKSSTSKVKENPLVRTNANLTANQYKENCIQLGMDKKNMEPIIDLIDSITNITASTTKADLISLLDSFKSLFINQEQEQTYKVKFEDERVAAIKFEALISSNFTNIRPVSSGAYVACLALADLASVGLLAQLGYSMTATIPLPNGAFQISFKDTI